MSANSSVAGNDERDQHLPAKILCGYVVDGPNLHGPFFIGPACYDYLLYWGLFEREFILSLYGLLAPLRIDQNIIPWLKSRMKEKLVILKNDIFSTFVTQATNVINVGCFGSVRSTSHVQRYFDIFSTSVTQATDVIDIGCFGGVSVAQVTNRGIWNIS
jgi:hypothetical protein